MAYPTVSAPLHYESIISPQAFDGIAFTFMSVAFVTTVVRIYWRAFYLKAFGLDDFLIAIGTLGAFVTIILLHYAVLHYTNLYYASVKAGHLLTFLPKYIHEFDLLFRYGSISDFVYVLVLPLLKCSILAFYVRIAAVKTHHKILYGLMTVVALQGIIVFILCLCSFSPLHEIWALGTYFQTHAPGYPLPEAAIQVANSCFQLLFDLVILSLPVPILLKTKFSQGRRAGLLFIYALSFLSLAGTTVRLVQAVYFNNSNNADSANPQTEFDTIVRRVLYATWTAIELTTIILCANLPAMHSLLRRIFGKPDPASRGYSYPRRSTPSSGAARFVPSLFRSRKPSSHSDLKHGPLADVEHLSGASHELVDDAGASKGEKDARDRSISSDPHDY